MRTFAEALAVAETWGKAPFDNDTITSVRALLSLPENELKKAIVDQFGYDLSFGTAGMRAVMDIGTARINEYTIARVSSAIAQVINVSAVADNSPTRSIVIGFDGRKHSEKFARVAARVFLAAGINVSAFNRIVPTPVVPFAVRRLNADCGVMITSSHNAAPYNGYKVYAANGAQILAPFDTDVMKVMADLPYSLPIGDAAPGKLVALDEQILRDYIEWVTSEVDFAENRSQKIIFTPLHGAAGALMNAAFYRSGFKNFLPVPQQYEPNPLFPTVKAPNPENKGSLDMAIEKAQTDNADLILATDGDGDRIGIAFRRKSDNATAAAAGPALTSVEKQGSSTADLENGIFVSLTGNQIGTVLLYYLLSKLRAQGKIRPNLFALCSLVSTPLTRVICEKFGITFYETLTGFKNMGNKADEVLKADPEARMVLAFEEAFGVTVGDSRDKDGIISNLLAAHISADGGFEHWLAAMYNECGYYAEDAVEKEFPGAAGIAAMNRLIERLRQNSPENFLGHQVSSLRDFQRRIEIRDGRELPITTIPSQNLLYFTNANGDWIAIRPSGTEPKVKAYVGVREQMPYSPEIEQLAQSRLHELCEIAARLLDA